MSDHQTPHQIASGQASETSQEPLSQQGFRPVGVPNQGIPPVSQGSQWKSTTQRQSPLPSMHPADNRNKPGVNGFSGHSGPPSVNVPSSDRPGLTGQSVMNGPSGLRPSNLNRTSQPYQPNMIPNMVQGRPSQQPPQFPLNRPPGLNTIGPLGQSGLHGSVPPNQMGGQFGPTQRPGMSTIAQPASSASADRPDELPVPFHGQGQYSHQVGMTLTPGVTPINSGPPSQRSSNTNSPATVNPNLDALEGQFRNTPDQDTESSTEGDGSDKQSSSDIEITGTSIIQKPSFHPTGSQVPPQKFSSLTNPTGPGPAQLTQPQFPVSGVSGVSGFQQNVSNQEPRFPSTTATYAHQTVGSVPSQRPGFPLNTVSSKQQPAVLPVSSSSEGPRFPLPPVTASQQQGFSQPGIGVQRPGFSPFVQGSTGSGYGMQQYPVSSSQQSRFQAAVSTTQPAGSATYSADSQKSGFPPASIASQQQGFSSGTDSGETAGFPPAPLSQQPGFIPISSTAGHFPQSSTTTSQQQGLSPPVSFSSQRPNYAPPPSSASFQSGFPPASTTNQRPGFPPQPMTRTQQPGYPASFGSQRPGFPPPPTSAVQQPGFQPPPTSAVQQPGFPPPPTSSVQQPGFPPPPTSAVQQPGFPPPPTSAVQQPGFPPSPTSSVQQPGFPPPPTSAVQQPGFPPPPTSAVQQPGFPPPPTSAVQRPVFPPPPTSAFQQPGFPPVSTQRPGFPPPVSAGQMPWFPPPPFSANQRPGFPPVPTSTQRPGFPPHPSTSLTGGQQANFSGNANQLNQVPGPDQFSQMQQGQKQAKSVQEFVNSYSSVNTLNASMGSMSLQPGMQTLNLLQVKNLIPREGLEVPKPNIPNDTRKVNCSPEVFRCTLNAIPQTSGLLNKARLPLGILIHPFKDLSSLPVIQSSVIVRCRSCRTYINPFVYFVDSRRWKCNLCYRVNELPDEFSFDPVSKTYGDPQRRPEIRSATIEFIAPSEYMLRPPQPAIYLYLLDVSFNAVETGYLNVFCETLLDVLDKIPGDSRTQIGFIAYDSAIHFFNLDEGLSQPQMLTVSDVDDIFLPCPDTLLVNLNESRERVIDLLNLLPGLFEGNMETGTALGAALQAGYKMTSSIGGRITVMQTNLPTVGPGALQNREDASQQSSKDVPNLGPATDFYKKLALDCSAQQLAVDLFMFNSQYADMASIECISKFSGGCVYYYPMFHHVAAPHMAEKFEVDLRRYLTRKVGFESVMRIRCSKGLSIHTFHGNFFVRSTDLLSLPNVNPDAGFGMQMSIEESLTDMSTMCFQAALLYTSSKGERRIRVHTLCLPVTNQLSEVYAAADQQAIIALLAKMAVDRCITSSMSDAREAIVNAAIDVLNSYGGTLTSTQRVGNLCINDSLRLMPLYCLALLKSRAFRVGIPTKLDDRVYAMGHCKSLPVSQLIQMIYPDLYPVHTIMEVEIVKKGSHEVPDLPVLQLSSANIDRFGAYLLDTGETIYLYIGSAINEQFCKDILDKPKFTSVKEGGMGFTESGLTLPLATVAICYRNPKVATKVAHWLKTELPELENQGSERMRSFLTYLLDSRPNGASFIIVREDGKYRMQFFQHFVEDRTESSMSYYEFLQHIQKQVKS